MTKIIDKLVNIYIG